MMTRNDLAAAVKNGLTAERKTLPPVLFYDQRGSALFEQITDLAEYYPTRTERDILRVNARDIARALAPRSGHTAVMELGAGTASKTEELLLAFALEGREVTFLPADVSPAPLELARARLAKSLPNLPVTPVVGTHEAGLRALREWQGPRVVLYLGSSIGNYDAVDAVALMREVKVAMGPEGRALLGVDRAKPLDVLLPAYDDARGVTAAFNRNVLQRINRELGGTFDPETFRHVARWNDRTSAVEMHLESTVDQAVAIADLGIDVGFRRGETIHTESSHKYTEAQLELLFASAELTEVATFTDERGWFSLHVLK